MLRALKWPLYSVLLTEYKEYGFVLTFFPRKFTFKTSCIIKVYIELSWRFLILCLHVHQNFVLRIMFF